jgi:hypothetical protein
MREMSDKSFQQRNEKKHRKLVRSPEKLSPCDFDPFLNPSLLSTSSNIFTNLASSNNSRSSPTKTYNDQFPPYQQAWHSSDTQDFAKLACTLPPSSSTPSMMISLHRKPSITIKYSKDEGCKSDTSPTHQSSLAHHQQISRSIDSNHAFTSTISTEHVDQMSNNFLINFPACISAQSKKNQQQQQQQQHHHEQNLSPFNYNDEFSSSNLYSQIATTTASTTISNDGIYRHRPSPTTSSQSLNLNLFNQSHATDASSGQIVFSSNNPFLSDNFDAITVHEDEGGGCHVRNKLDELLNNIDASNDTELLFFTADDVKKMTAAAATTTTTTVSGASVKACDSKEENFHPDEDVLKNKREKFSNASPTMKICLVVSPPTNKVFHVSMICGNVFLIINSHQLLNEQIDSLLFYFILFFILYSLCFFVKSKIIFLTQ